MHHEFWIVTAVNRLLGGTVASLAHSLGFTLDPANAIPAHIVMSVLVVLVISALALTMRSRLSVENPGKLQIVLEDLVSFVLGILREYIGPKGDKYLPLIASVGLFIFVANAMGKVPGLMSPTANINTTVGCAVTVWVFYHLMGFREQGVWNYLKHFAIMPGAPLWIAPLVLIIEIISHASRVLSLSLRLFGNVFGEEMVVAIIGSLLPFVAPLPFMLLGVITGTLQAFIFVMLTIIYLAAAVHTEHEHEDAHHADEAGAHAAA
jgi:F-type H+-transporting ATPase subunit a